MWATAVWFSSGGRFWQTHVWILVWLVFCFWRRKNTFALAAVLLNESVSYSLGVRDSNSLGVRVKETSAGVKVIDVRDVSEVSCSICLKDVTKGTLREQSHPIIDCRHSSSGAKQMGRGVRVSGLMWSWILWHAHRSQDLTLTANHRQIMLLVKKLTKLYTTLSLSYIWAPSWSRFQLCSLL